MANNNNQIQAKELAQDEMVCLILETKALQEAIDRCATCAEGGMFSLYVQNKLRKFQTTEGEFYKTRCVLVSTSATAQAMVSVYATVRTFRGGAVATEGVEKTLEVVLAKEFAADIAACEGFPQVVIGVSPAGIRIQAENAEKDARDFFIPLANEAPQRFSKKAGEESVEMTVDGSELAEAVQMAAAGAYAPEKGGNLVSFLPEIRPDGNVVIHAVGHDNYCAAKADLKVEEVSEDHEFLRNFLCGFCPLDAKRLQAVISAEGLKGAEKKVKLRIFADTDKASGKRGYRRVDLFIEENLYMLVAGSRQVVEGILNFFGDGASNVVMTVDVRALGKAVSVAEIGIGKTAAVMLSVEEGGLRISDKSNTHTARCMKVKSIEAPEGASITCGSGLLKNALRACGDSAEFRFCSTATDSLRFKTVKGWQIVFMPVVPEQPKEAKEAEKKAETEKAE